LSGERCGPHLPFLCVVWKFHKNPIKPRFICAASSTSLTEVLSTKLFFLQSMTFGCQNSERQVVLVLVVGFSMTLQE
jgi:hypothetical protein